MRDAGIRAPGRNRGAIYLGNLYSYPFLNLSTHRYIRRQKYLAFVDRHEGQVVLPTFVSALIGVPLRVTQPRRPRGRSIAIPQSVTPRVW